MKKNILILFAISIACSSSAQQIMSKKGYPILPEKGDWSIGFDVVPFLEYTGNLFNNTNINKSPSADYKQNSPFAISGLYVKNENTAYRAKVRLGINKTKTDTLVGKAGSTNANETVVDETKVNNTNIVIGYGIQKWKGHGKVKGIYGVEGLLSITGNKTLYSYGNALSSQNQVQNRLKSNKTGTGFGFQIRGFIGVEYFFAPKMSLSAEYGWGPSINSIGAGEIQRESWNGNSVDTSIEKTGKSSEFGFDVDNAGGAINLSFYF